jgi:hypothetical protein
MNSASAEITCHHGTYTFKKFDLLWILVLIGILAFLLVPAGHELFVRVSISHVYLMAFFKFAVLATMGELLATRILNGAWSCPSGLIWRAVIWGFLGTLIALVFYLYATGVSGALQIGLLPSLGAEGFGSRFSFAIFTSALMNLLFAPTFMAFHRITDTYIDMGDGKINRIMHLKLAEVLGQVDWNGFIRFVVCKTIPFFWIPAHTITFLLPPEHRVLAAAVLSIALGAILAISKNCNHQE